MDPKYTLDARRRAAVALCEYAVGLSAGAVGDGRPKDDPVYVEVTEGRDGPTPERRKAYSSCADLGHWLLERLGCREKFVNRKTAPSGYRIGLNISKLAYSKPARAVTAAFAPEPGDILLIWNRSDTQDAHCCVWLDGTSNEGRIANYGAGGMSPGLRPGCNIRKTPLIRVANGASPFKLGTRYVQKWISLADVPITGWADLTGAALTGEDIDALCEEPTKPDVWSLP